MYIYQQPDAKNVLSLLELGGLPIADLKEDSLENYLCCGDKNNPVGIIGLEFFDGFGLLRSR